MVLTGCKWVSETSILCTLYRLVRNVEPRDNFYPFATSFLSCPLDCPLVTSLLNSLFNVPPSTSLYYALSPLNFSATPPLLPSLSSMALFTCPLASSQPGLLSTQKEVRKASWSRNKFPLLSLLDPLPQWNVGQKVLTHANTVKAFTQIDEQSFKNSVETPCIHFLMIPFLRFNIFIDWANTLRTV